MEGNQYDVSNVRTYVAKTALTYPAVVVFDPATEGQVMYATGTNANRNAGFILASADAGAEVAVACGGQMTAKLAAGVDRGKYLRISGTAGKVEQAPDSAISYIVAQASRSGVTDQEIPVKVMDIQVTL
jgi:hypothetical protein